jgi:hypothetical protein
VLRTKTEPNFLFFLILNPILVLGLRRRAGVGIRVLGLGFRFVISS